MLYIEQPAGVGFSYCAKTAPSCTFSDVTQVVGPLSRVVALSSVAIPIAAR